VIGGEIGVTETTEHLRLAYNSNGLAFWIPISYSLCPKNEDGSYIIGLDVSLSVPTLPVHLAVRLDLKRNTDLREVEQDQSCVHSVPAHRGDVV
jgi:hypothetical protein